MQITLNYHPCGCSTVPPTIAFVLNCLQFYVEHIQEPAPRQITSVKHLNFTPRAWFVIIALQWMDFRWNKLFDNTSHFLMVDFECAHEPVSAHISPTCHLHRLTIFTVPPPIGPGIYSDLIGEPANPFLRAFPMVSLIMCLSKMIPNMACLVWSTCAHISKEWEDGPERHRSGGLHGIKTVVLPSD